MSGVVASFAATPPDVVKTRILSQDKWTQERKKKQPQPAAQLPVMVTANLDSTLALSGNSTSADWVQQLGGGEDFTSQSYYNAEDRNPIVVARTIIEREGSGVLFSGVSERCIGAIPRFGTTLAMHDFLEQVVAHQGWLAHTTLS